MDVDADGSGEESEQSVGGGEPTVTAPESHLVGEGLTVSYRDTDDPVVECERFDLPDGEITALVGPNGSGKSTLLKTLSNQLSPDEGTVLLDGRAISEFGNRELARTLGRLSQENESPDGITVEDMVSHGRYPHRGFFDAPDASDHRAVDRAIERTGIAHLRDTDLGNLSGGQKQLVWIAMALAQETDVLLLDEPTTFLDMRHQLRVLDIVRTINEEDGVTVGVVLHDIEQAARFADYVVALDDGAVYDWGPPEQVVTEELLATVFGVEAAVSTAPDVRIVPKRPLDD